ncbi:MAG: formylglycine-generating enzyme family protein, partial [Chloroflexota bacterium]|nr:formylglycine-generating enzyme family protein [Chloroflexota bacterium]
PAPATPPPIVGLPTATPTDTPQALPPTLSSFEQLQTAQMQLTQSAATQAAADVRATEDTVLSANASATAQQIMATEAAAYATLLALSWTPMPMFTPPPTATLPLTPRPTATLTVAPTPDRASGLVAVTRNDAWTPIIRAFEGVDMALVPVGCFMMGSTEYPNEQPVHEVCFDAPFWIDVTEVTQFQFRAFGGVAANDSSFTGDQRPVESITWFEAYAYCVNQRGMRLPSEAEWEYAARGVESWVYPWGDSFSAENVVYNRSSSDGTADVGSRPAGASWVGALDLSGNVWEWVNTIYNQDRFPYPYDQSDGRETYSDNRTDARVLRGGSWDFTNTGGLRAPNRVRSSPDGGFYNSGFRCSAS